jgi:hypothetical protein
MTPEEHQLIVEMFKQQALYYAGLIQILKSRGILCKGDLEAFDALVSSSSRELLEQNVEAEYLSSAAILGVITGLPRKDGF